MSTAVQPETKAAPKSKMAIFGGVSIHNIHLISDRLLKIFEYVLTVMEPDHGLFSMVMDGNGKPTVENDEPVMAMLYPESMSVVFNLIFCFDESKKLVIKSNKKHRMSLRAMVWYNTMISLFHEIHHAKTINAELAKQKPQKIKWTDKMEDEAYDWAERRVRDLAKVFPVEMPTNEEEPFYHCGFVEWREELEKTKGKAKYIALQKRLYDENVVCTTITEDEGDTIDIMSFKEFMRQTSRTAEERDDPVWNNEATMKYIPTDGTIANPAGVIKDPAAQSVQIPTEAPTVAPTVQATFEDTDMGVDPGWDEPVEDFAPPGWHTGPVNTPAPSAPVVTPTAPTQVVTPNPAGGFVSPVIAAQNQPVQTNAQEQSNMPKYIGPVNLPIEEIKAIIKEVTMRLYNHVFTKCGFNPFNPQAPGGFENGGAIYDPVSIADIPNANKVFVAMDITDRAGTKQNDVPITGHISGQVFKNSQIPGYWVWVNVNGYKVKRSIVPQNMNKMKEDGSGLKQYAIYARQGWCVMWVIQDKYGNYKSEMKAKIECQPGGSIVYVDNPFGNN